MKKVIVRNKTRDCLLGDAIERADTSQTRRTGLLKRTGLAKGEGLWILPCEGIHTFFMKFPIDVLFLNRKKQVVKALPSLGPWRLAMSLRGRSVLELPLGTIRETGTQRGDQIEIIERDLERS